MCRWENEASVVRKTANNCAPPDYTCPSTSIHAGFVRVHHTLEDSMQNGMYAVIMWFNGYTGFSVTASCTTTYFTKARSLCDAKSIRRSESDTFHR